MEEKQYFFVESTDERKFKMVIRGDLGRLTVSKVRRYLKSYGVPDGQVLTFNGVPLSDDQTGDSFGLTVNAVMKLHDPKTFAGAVGSTEGSTRLYEASGQQPGSSKYNSPQLANQPPAAVPKKAWVEPSSPAAAQGQSSGNLYSTSSPRDTAGTDQLRAQIAALKADLDRVSAANAALQQQAHYGKRSGDASSGASTDAHACAKENLSTLGRALKTSLQFDPNFTCVIGTDEDFSILVTFDPATERLYMYSTLLTSLPEDPAVRMKLYEILLEGSLLGREVCGGGIGISKQNNVVVLSTSIFMRECGSNMLSEQVPTFVETLRRWRALVNELVRA